MRLPFHIACRLLLRAAATIEGSSFLSAKEAPRKTGMKLPSDGQPYQGFSGNKSMGDGRLWMVLDNGEGDAARRCPGQTVYRNHGPKFVTARAFALGDDPSQNGRGFPAKAAEPAGGPADGKRAASGHGAHKVSPQALGAAQK